MTDVHAAQRLAKCGDYGGAAELLVSMLRKNRFTPRASTSSASTRGGKGSNEKEEDEDDAETALAEIKISIAELYIKAGRVRDGEMYISQTARYAESLPLHLDQPLSHGGGPREQQRKRRVYTAHRILYGRSLEAKGRFLDAAVRYFDIASSLSTWLGVREDSDGISIDEGRETDYSEEEEDTRPLFLFLSLHPNELSSASSSALRPCSSISFLSLLQEAINCCILSPANPFKARLLRSLTQDRRFLHNIHRLDHVDLLQAMERKSFVSFQDVSAVATDTVVFHAIHQKEEEKKKKKESEKETESGEESAIHSVVKLAVLTNNLLATSEVYHSISFNRLSSLLRSPADELEKLAGSMIREGHLEGEIDEIEKRLYFFSFSSPPNTLSQGCPSSMEEKDGEDRHTSSPLSFCEDIERLFKAVREIEVE